VSHYPGADDPERRKWQNPERILAEIGLGLGQVFMDIGCGGGFFTLPAARLVGDTGRVYGVDSDPRAITELRTRAASEGLTNLEAVLARAEDTILCRICADIVFLGIVLHDFDDPAQVLRNARQMLKPAGRLINLDWKKEAAPVGPPLAKRFSKETAVGLIGEAGFRVVATRDSGPYHYLIVAQPVSAA
jgi:ubiquinone/menaquinone biosynthesis C-methylase UbiE